MVPASFLAALFPLLSGASICALVFEKQKYFYFRRFWRFFSLALIACIQRLSDATPLGTSAKQSKWSILCIFSIIFQLLFVKSSTFSNDLHQCDFNNHFWENCVHPVLLVRIIRTGATRSPSGLGVMTYFLLLLRNNLMSNWRTIKVSYASPFNTFFSETFLDISSIATCSDQ